MLRCAGLDATTQRCHVLFEPSLRNFSPLKVKDTGLDQGVRSLHLLWAEGSLGIPGYTWHIWLNGSDFRIESSGCLGTLYSPYDVAKSHDRLNMAQPI